jgi:hypothetical protein
MEEFSDMPTITPGRYRHYKGTLYNVLGVGCHSETLEYFVVYAPIHENEGRPKIWMRPYDMFFETVVVDGKTVSRFQKIDDVL